MSSRPRRPLTTALTIACLAASTLPAAACKNAVQALTAPAAEGLFTALSDRFHNVQRDQKFAYAKVRFSKYALTPSKVWDDAAVWGRPAPTTNPLDNPTSRLLTVQGRPDGTQYWLAARADPPYPTRPGETRHTIALRRLGDSEYEWNTAVDMAV